MKKDSLYQIFFLINDILNVQEINPMEEEKIEGLNYSKAWSTRHASILGKYTTGEKLTIVSSYLPGGEKGM